MTMEQMKKDRTTKEIEVEENVRAIEAHTEEVPMVKTSNLMKVIRKKKIQVQVVNKIKIILEVGKGIIIEAEVKERNMINITNSVLSVTGMAIMLVNVN